VTPATSGLDPPDIEVILPRALTAEADGQRRLRVSCDRAVTVRHLLAEIATRYPLLGRRLLDETGQLRRFVNLYVDGEDVRRSSGLETPIGLGQQVQIIQSVAGG
jgi:molybdopterin converting factor small subunit